MDSLGKYFSLTGFRRSITLYGRRGPASSPTHSNKMSMISTATSIHKYTRQARREYTSISRFSGNGSFSRFGTEQLAISAQSMAYKGQLTRVGKQCLIGSPAASHLH